MYDMNKEVADMVNMIDWFGKNFDELPFGCQLEYMGELMKFSESIKPIYIKALMYMGGE